MVEGKSVVLRYYLGYWSARDVITALIYVTYLRFCGFNIYCIDQNHVRVDWSII